ncbi:unnamed protein product [Rhodiola kirilowii]
MNHLHSVPDWVQSPCLWEEISIFPQLGFLAILACHLLGGGTLRQLRRRNLTEDESVNKSQSEVKLGLAYIATIISSITMLATAMLLKQLNGGCVENVVPVFSSAIIQVLCWVITLIILQQIRNKKRTEFPWTLRAWWLCSFVIFSIRTVVHSIHYLITYHEHVRMSDIADFIRLAASTCLVIVAVIGKTGLLIVAVPDPDGITEPLIGEPIQDDVPDVDIKDSAEFLSCSFQEILKQVMEKDGTTKPSSIYKVIRLFVRKKAAINASFAVVSACASYVGPYLINDLVSFLSDKSCRSIESGYLLALAFLGAKMIETISERQWMFGARQLGLRLRAALISKIYQKGLLLSSKARQTHGSGEIINYMSVDVQRVIHLMWYANIIWMLPIQITLAILILRTTLGWGSAAALAVTLIVMAFNIPLTRFQSKYQSKIMDAKDARMKATSEVLKNMKTLKLQAWDNKYLGKLEALRGVEYIWLWKSLRLAALSGFIFWGSPTFISVTTFGACMAMGIKLTHGRVLSALATFRMLQDPIFSLPDLLSVIAKGKVSIDRIASFLREDEIQGNSVELIPDDKETDYAIDIENGMFGWSQESNQPTLREIQLKAKKGMKVAVCGTVGSGKSSLISCILGRLRRSREAPYDKDRYARTVKACALEKDFELFLWGDLTEIGERGINMSGGQKQRIQIARAVYQDADIYLLDDPFSAVDAHTGTQLFRECLMGILKETTILYVTHHVEFLPAADLILVMQNGRIAQAGKFEQLLTENTGSKAVQKYAPQCITFPDGIFDSTPTGRILSRASSDQSVLDLEIGNKIGFVRLLSNTTSGTIAVMSQVAWEVFVIFIPVTAICIWYQRYYIPTARELARLSQIQRAPILHHFAESLAGAATIRAFDQEDRFFYANLGLIDNQSRALFHNVSALEWLSFRLNVLSNFVFAFSLVLLVSLPEGIISPSLAGLAVTYGINLNEQLASVIWNISSAENKMISAERILQYSKLTSEAPLVVESCSPPPNWPDNGSICFKNLQIRYAEHLPPVLESISCTFPGKKKIGIVGRTGSGKSTLIHAIFRIVEPWEGTILIDGVDITRIGLHDLRSRLSIIPQDPTLFEGTVRGNLDPLEQYPEKEIWEVIILQALDKCQLGDIVRAKEGRLDSVVVENGENWSVGQRQLFCLGRALLKKSSILVLDEATASVDSATDGLIQMVINQEFRNRTVVTIAHRIHTVIDSDLVLVLSDGRIAEYDSPAKLLERDETFFSKLIKEYTMR